MTVVSAWQKIEKHNASWRRIGSTIKVQPEHKLFDVARHLGVTIDTTKIVCDGSANVCEWEASQQNICLHPGHIMQLKFNRECEYCGTSLIEKDRNCPSCGAYR